MTNSDYLKQLLDKFDIKPKNLALYNLAFTHPSSNEKNNYEKLEFIGDAVLDKITAMFLYNKYPNYSVGDMSKTHSLITMGKSLTIASKDLLLKNIIYVSPSFNIEKITDKILEDVFEAFLGAVYLDQGELVVEKILKRTIFQYYQTNRLDKNSDFKSKIIEHANKNKIKIQFNDTMEDPYTHNSTLILDNKPISKGKGNTKIDAQQQAAKIALSKIEKKYS